MDPDTFILQTAPYVILVGECPAGHVHVLGGFVSDVPPDEEEPQDTYNMNHETGKVLRYQSDIAFSLN